MAVGFAIAAVLAFCVPIMVIRIIASAGGVILLILLIWMITLYRAFAYQGKRQMMRVIIEGVSSYMDIPADGSCLDVGCGSGALTITCAKKYPYGSVTVLDRWGKEYTSFSKPLFERNAETEGVTNVQFMQGDAVYLPFPDESFAAVVNKYVYRNIPSRDRQGIILETLQVLKKGGTFAINDIFSSSKYGDMTQLVQKLK